MLARLWCEWSVNVASWKRCMSAWFRCKWSVDVVSWQRWVLALLRCKRSVDRVSWKKKSASVASVQRKIMVWLHSRCKCKYCFSRQMQVLAQLHDKDKWCHDFDAKKKYGCNFIVKVGVNMALVQGQMLMWLYCKDFWWGYVAKTLDVAMLQDPWYDYVAKTLEMAALKRQVLVHLNCQDKGK